MAQWTFNEEDGATIAVDSSGHGHHGTIFGGATRLSSTGGKALSLNGTSQFVEVPSSPAWNPQGASYTVLAWLTVRNDGGPIGNDKMIIGIPNRVWSLGMWRPDNKYWSIGHLTSSPAGTPLASTLDGEQLNDVQQMVGYSKAVDEQIRFWLDDFLAASGGGAAPHVDAGEQVVHIGFCCGGNYLEAEIDEIRIYDEYLFDAAVSNLFVTGPSTNLNITVPPSNEVQADDVFSTGFVSRDFRTYELESTDDLVTSNWTGTAIFLKGNGTNMTFTVPTDASSTKSYRLVVN